MSKYIPRTSRRAGVRRQDNPAYTSWLKMKERCTNPRCSRWKWYGARGIGVCDRWIRSFDNFLSDMGPRPIGMSLDRIDANGNYEPGNCRWATKQQQARNRRDTILVTVADQRMPLREACDQFGVSFAQAYWRVAQCGMSVDDAFALTCAASFSLASASSGIPRASIQVKAIGQTEGIGERPISSSEGSYA